MKKNIRILLLIVLFFVGILAFMGAFVLVELNSSGNYSKDLLSVDLIKSVLSSAISLSYPFYYVLKKKKKSD